MTKSGLNKRTKKDTKESNRKEDGNKMNIERIKMIFYSIVLSVICFIAITNMHNYTAKATVIQVTKEEVKIKDDLGYLWNFYGNDFSVGDRVAVTFNDNGTDNIAKDDVIVKVKKVNK